MGTLYLVRHGQASLGADDYDQLSPLGVQQCVALGTWMRSRNLSFDAVLRGTLRRHDESLAFIAEGFGDLPPVMPTPMLNEYDSEALIRCVRPGSLERPLTPEGIRDHFRLLRDALRGWMSGELEPVGMPSWQTFSQGVIDTVESARTQFGGDVLLVTSGGPISTAVGTVLGVPAAGIVELNMRLRNSSITELVTTRSGCALLSFNTIPHLDDAQRRAWATYA